MLTKFPGLELDLSFHPADPSRARRFSPEQIEHYNAHGYITGVTLFEGERVNELRRYFLETFPRLTEKLRGPGSESQINFHHELRGVYDVVTDPTLAAHLRDLLGPDVVCFITQLVTKKPRALGRTVWHQDSTYNGMDSRSVVVWLAVTDATIDNGCMWFIPGSHLAEGQYEFEQAGPEGDSLGGHLVREAEKKGTPVPIELRAGQAVFFSDKLLHSARGNQTEDRTRAGFTMSFTSAAVKPRYMDNIASVICCGQDREGNWKPHHARPE